MATENYSMFGGSALPEELQRQLLEDRASKYAALTPEQRAAQGTYQSAYGVGQGLAKAMGVDIQDPRIKRQMTLQQLSQGVENTSEGLKAFAQKLSAAGFNTEAAQALDKAREIAASEAGTGLKTAQAEKARNYETATADATKKRNLLSDVEQSLASGEQVDPSKLNQARLAWAQETKPKTFQQPDGSIATVPGVDANLFPNLNKALTSGGAGGGVTKAGTIETKTSQAMAEKEVATIEGSITGIDDSLNAIKGIRDIRTGSISTNPFLVEQMKKYPTAAKAQDNLLKTITAGKVVETIMEMKQQSKTGATGFGALNTRELELLESTARALDPASPTFEKDLKYIEDKLTASKTKLQGSLAKKQPAQTGGGGNNNWQNPQGKEGQLAVLNAELAKAQQQGNQADIAGLQREIKALGGQPSNFKINDQMSDAQKIELTLSNPRNKGRTRAEVEAALRKNGDIK